MHFENNPEKIKILEEMNMLKDGKRSLKADEPQVGQRREDMERKREYYIIIFPENT